MITGGVLVGIEGRLVGVEVSMRGGLPGIEIVGLAGRTVQEAARRVRSAMAAAGCRLPPRQIVVSLTPADLPKHGASLDLAIAAGLLVTTGHLAMAPESTSAFWGEVGLDGLIRSAPGVLPFAVAARKAGHSEVIVSPEDADLACLAGIRVRVVRSLTELLTTGPTTAAPRPAQSVTSVALAKSESAFASIAGLAGPVRASLIAAAGGHHCCFLGPPGAGKSLLARSIHALLPPPDNDELLEITAMVALRPPADGSRHEEDRLPAAVRPLREPLTGISLGGLLGRGRPFMIGEASLAHRGVLVLDELGHHRAEVLTALCLCMDRHWVELRADVTPLRVPAWFQVAATSNLCPCGRTGSVGAACTCSATARAAFWRRLSGPLMDRLDLQVEVLGPDLYDLDGLHGGGEGAGRDRATVPCATVPVGEGVVAPSDRLGHHRTVVALAWGRAAARYGKGFRNGTAPDSSVIAAAALSSGAREVLGEVHRELGLSARGYLSVLRVARTIADLAGQDSVDVEHVAEAAAYRTRRGQASG